jgi:putative transposase
VSTATPSYQGHR